MSCKRSDVPAKPAWWVCAYWRAAETGAALGRFGHQRQMPVVVPMAGSPVIDAAHSCGDLFDQRGRPRPQDGDGNGNASYDIGAIERQPGDGAPARTPRVRLPLIVR